MSRSALAIAITLSFVLAAPGQAREIKNHGVHHHRYAALHQQPRPEDTVAVVGPWWPGPNDMGQTGYYGGSSGGIPSPTVYYPAYSENGSAGILPEDRPYPVWTQPGRLLR
jgi:ABC-type glycerol-3-phosphate transport system substrate-binding protein